MLQICNACRYCEGFCAVFPAMTRRLEFRKADVHYLANLCHNCGACLHACQYAPPHEFARQRAAGDGAGARRRPTPTTRGRRRSARCTGATGSTLSLALAAGLALFLVLAVALNGSLWHEPLAGDFYAVFPHNLMVAMFAPVFVFAVLALAIGVRRFWRRRHRGAGVRLPARRAKPRTTCCA